MKMISSSERPSLRVKVEIQLWPPFSKTAKPFWYGSGSGQLRFYESYDSDVVVWDGYVGFPGDGQWPEEMELRVDYKLIRGWVLVATIIGDAAQEIVKTLNLPSCLEATRD